MRPFSPLLLLILVLSSLSIISAQENSSFQSPVSTDRKPWTEKRFENEPDNFQFAILTDRTGGHRKGVFGKAIEKLNLLMPEFVMSVGDLIEGSRIPDTIDSQWAEFDKLLQPLAMRFFYVPGNHDIANELMRSEWLERYGRSYYHFIYKNVLFLALDSTDGDDDATFSDDQINYFKKVLADHPDVRWTLLFMHHPVWMYRSFNGFIELEEALKDRPYTMYAGHHHRYMQAVRKERNYYVLATTGGGSQLRGPQFGEFDHVTWITMTDDGPRMLNLKLDGMLRHDIASAREAALRDALLQAADFNGVMTINEERTAGKILLNIANTAEDTLYFDGRIFHNHHLELDQSILHKRIAPGQAEAFVMSWHLNSELPFERIDPVEMDFTIGFRPEVAEPPFQLEGTYPIPKVIKEQQIGFMEPILFLDQAEVTLTTPVQGLVIHYTTDGSQPTLQSPVYTAPIPLKEDATIKAALFDPASGSGTDFLEQTYHKVPLHPATKVRRDKPGLSYQYFEGNFQTLPDFNTLSPVRSGMVTDFDLEQLSEDRLDHFAVLYTGLIEVPEDGLYTFYVRSDDGSKLFIDGELVVDNDGSHSARTRSGYIALQAGKHPIRIEYFEDFLGEELSLYVQNPGDDQRRKVVFEQLSH